MEEKINILNFPLLVFRQKLFFLIISISSFAIPFILGHPQWLVGSVVNASLFLAAIFLTEKFFLPLSIFPSIAVLLRGVIFGPFTYFLIYFLPFIWLANLILIFSFKIIYNRLKINFYSLKFFLSVFFFFFFKIFIFIDNFKALFQISFSTCYFFTNNGDQSIFYSNKWRYSFFFYSFILLCPQKN